MAKRKSLRCSPKLSNWRSRSSGNGFLAPAFYERTLARQGYANGYKAERIDTSARTVCVQVPKTAGSDGEAFYSQSLERGRRSVRTVMLAVAEMYIKGVSTR